MQNNLLINIIYQDEDIIVLAKPSGVLTIPDRFNKNEPCLYKLLKIEFPDIFVVHRLDKDTSGVIIFAKNAEAHKFINQQFQEHTITKIYHAIVSGIVNKDEMDIDIPIIPHPAKKGLSKPSARGKESLSKVKILERFRLATLVEVNLVTGRHHQLRVHCASVGHPLLVDVDYGSSSEFFLSTIKRRFNLKKDDVEKPIISRITMHAHSIAFIHPSSKEKVCFKTEYPKDIQALIKVLRKYSSMPSYYNPIKEYDFS